MVEGQTRPTSTSFKPVDIQTYQLNEKRKREVVQERKAYNMKKAAQRKIEEAVKREKAAKIRRDAAEKRKVAAACLSPRTSATYVKVNETTQKKRLASKSGQIKTGLDSILCEVELTFSRRYTHFFKKTRLPRWYDFLESTTQQKNHLTKIRNYRKRFNLSKDLSDMGIFSNCRQVIQDLRNASNTRMNKFSTTNRASRLRKPGEELDEEFQTLLERIDALELTINEAPECSIADAGDRTAAGPTGYPEAAGCADTQECSIADAGDRTEAGPISYPEAGRMR